MDTKLRIFNCSTYSHIYSSIDSIKNEDRFSLGRIYDKNYDIVFKLLPRHIVSLKIAYCDIKILNLEKYIRLKRLIIIGGSGILESVKLPTSIKICTIRKSKIKSIGKIPNIRNLVIEDSNIEIININEMKKIEYLSLPKNNISHISFPINNNLRRINLCVNPLKYIDISKCHNLKSLYLDNCNINDKFIDKFMVYHKGINYISLSNNNIEKIETIKISKLSNLKNISVSKNKLRFVPQNYFDSNSNLRFVYLYGNNIYEIPKYLFSKCPNIKLINMNNMNNGTNTQLIINHPFVPLNNENLKLMFNCCCINVYDILILDRYMLICDYMYNVIINVNDISKRGYKYIFTQQKYKNYTDKILTFLLCASNYTCVKIPNEIKEIICDYYTLYILKEISDNKFINK